ncbi:MAG: chloride channel protein [Candidatus Cloacimonetes bacterium]|nr:chloride channel protein [Candidatus Cloacimonadota bacterium]
MPKSTLARRVGVSIRLIFKKLHIHASYSLIFLAGCVGYLTAIGAVLFVSGINFLQGLTQQVLENGQNPLYFLAIPITGMLLCSSIIHFFAKESKGHGVPEVIFSVLIKNGVIHVKTVFAKFFATIICLGSYGSAGREGPIVLIGSAIGSSIAQLLKLKPNSIRTLVGCGASAGIAATFNAPIGGVLFSLEILLHTFSPSTFVPVVISAVIASVAFKNLMGAHHTFVVNVNYSENSIEIFNFAVLGILCGLIAVAFTFIWYKTDRYIRKTTIPFYIKAIIGGLYVGCIILLYKDLGGSGYKILQSLLDGNLTYTPQILLIFLLLKFSATIVTICFGGSGGVFAPSLVMGGIIGAIFHYICSMFFVVSPVGIYVVIGMASFVSGSTHGPITAILVLCEMSHNYDLILPLLASCIAATIAARAINELNIYTIKLKDRGIHLKDGHDLDILKTYHVCDLMETNIPSVSPDTPLNEAFSKLQTTHHGYCLVKETNGAVIGIISYNETIAKVISKKTPLDIKVNSVMHISKKYVFSFDHMIVPYDKFLRMESEYLMVLNDDMSFAGLILKKDLMRSYKKALHNKSIELSQE